MLTDFMKKMQRRMKKRQRRKMKAAIKLIRAFTDLKEGSHNLDDDGWIDVYTYEPLNYGKGQLLNVLNALLCVADRSELQWEFRLFACDGMITTRADGSKPANSDETCIELIDHANAE